MNYESVARLGAFNVEGSRLRIGTPAALYARGVNAARINCGRNHMVARLDPKHGSEGAGEGVVEFFGFEAMGLGETGCSQSKRQEQFHMYPPSRQVYSEQIVRHHVPRHPVRKPDEQ